MNFPRENIFSCEGVLCWEYQRERGIFFKKFWNMSSWHGLFYKLSPAPESVWRFLICKHHRWFPLFLPPGQTTPLCAPRHEHVCVLNVESGQQAKQNESQSPGTWSMNDPRENCGLGLLAIHLLWVVQWISNASASWQPWQGAVIQWEVWEGNLAGEVVPD